MKIDIPHLSYSSLNTYDERCPRAWYLGKVKQAEEAVAWFSMIGTAVHDGVEHKIKTGEEKSAEELFYPLVEAGLLIEPDTSKWLSGGKLDDPTVEDKATEQVRQCLEAAWAYLEDVEVWEVEYDATGYLPGCEVPIKAFVDIVGEHKKHGPCIIDWKTGSTKPKSAVQLETYAALLPAKGYDPDVGIWAMLKDGVSKPRPIDLSAVDAGALGERYQAVLERIRRGIFPTNANFLCKYCFQSPNCKLQSGSNERTMYYDTVEADGFLPY